jgi:hypothetical protein
MIYDYFLYFINPLAIPFLLSYFFWGRGIYSSKGGDLILGLILFIFSSFFSLALIPHSGSLNFIGLFWIVFRIITVILKHKIDESKKLIITKNRARDYGILIIFWGILFSLAA